MTHTNRYDTLDFRITLHSPRQRGRYRVAVRGLSLYIDELAQTFDIYDLSSSGCNLCAPGQMFALGRIFDGGLCIGSTRYLLHLKMKVERHIAVSNIACAFQIMYRRQEIMLDKLVLELQKRNIVTLAARRKREEERWRHMLR